MAAPVASARHIEINGASLYVEERGGTPLFVLLHAGFLSSTMWEATVTVLARHVRVITFDKRGHGRSTNPSKELSLRRIADDTAVLIEALDLGDTFVGGSSPRRWDHPRVRHALPGSGARLVGAAPTDWRHDAATLTTLHSRVYADQTGMIDFDTFHRESPEFVTFLRLMHPLSAEHWQGIDPTDADQWRALPSLTQEQVQQITTPTLVISGDRDNVVPLAEAWKLYHWLPKAELAILPGCDHARPVEAPATFAAAVVDFIERHQDNGSQTADHHAS